MAVAEEAGSVAGGVFISYRRVDSSPWALRIADHLVLALGTDQVFVDVDALSPGEDFADVIDATLQRCPVVLVLIGRRWLTVQSPRGSRRLDDPGDLVRIEVTTALERADVVIPVLVDGAAMPFPDDLPAPLRGLARAVPLDLAGDTFDNAMAGLLDRVHGVLGRPRPTLRQRTTGFLASTLGFLLVTAIALGLVWVSAPLLLADGPPSPEAPPSVAEVAVPGGGSELLLADGSLWVWSTGEDELRRLSTSGLEVETTISLPEDATELVVAEGRIWVGTGFRGGLAQVDPDSGAVLNTVDTGADVTALASDGGNGLWVGLADDRNAYHDNYGTVATLDLVSGVLGRRLAVDSAPTRVADDGAVLWLVRNDDTVARVEVAAAVTGPVAEGVTVAGPYTEIDGVPSPVAWRPIDVAIASGSVWALDGDSPVLHRLDPASGYSTHQTRLSGLGLTDTRLAVTADGLWVLDGDRLVLVDPGSGEVTGTVDLPRVDETVVDEESVWGVTWDGERYVVRRWQLDDVLEPA